MASGDATKDRDAVLVLSNFRATQKDLARIAPQVDLDWLDGAAAEVARKWFRLGQKHLRTARCLSNLNREWRSVISRCYYAAYNASKSVRYYAKGQVDLTGKDHQAVGELPNSFPDKAHWASFVDELRRDRNVADYEPWKNARRKLTHSPQDALTKTADFVGRCRDCLREKGVLP